MKSQTEDDFWRLYRKLPRNIRQSARRTYKQFVIDPSVPGIHFHRLRNFPDLWSVRVSQDYRAVGIVDGDTIYWFWIGSHAEFDREFPE